MRRSLAAGLAILAIASIPSTTSAQSPRASATSSAASPARGMELRAIDRATVRILTVRGASQVVRDGRATRARRVWAAHDAAFGSGFFVSTNGLVATARHVVAGADTIGVLKAGSEEAFAARVVYVDPQHDIAFLHVDGTVPAIITVPSAARRLVVAEAITGSGFPWEVAERDPAAFVGIVGRENENGTIHAYLPVNPGNSGGPVTDARGELVGLVSRGGTGIGVLEPLRFILPGLAIAQANLTANVQSYSEGNRLAVLVLADALGTEQQTPVYERTSVDLIDRALTGGVPNVEAGILLGLHAWNMHIALLEEHEALEVAELPEAERAIATRLRSLAMRSLRQAFDRAPYLSVTYPAGLSVLAQGESSVVVRARSTFP